MKTLTDRQYAELLKKAARAEKLEVENQQLRAEIEETEIRAEAEEAEAHADAAEEIKEERARTKFWVRAWWDALFWLQGAWEQVHALSARLTHTEKLMANKKLKPEQKLYLYAAAPLAIAPKHRDHDGRAQIARAEVAERAGLPESTCYRAAKELEGAGIIDAKSPYNPLKGKRVRFEKFAPAVADAPETLDPGNPERGGAHLACHTCESDDTIIERQTVQTVKCCECGTVSKTILPVRTFYNPQYWTTEPDPANPGKCHHVRMRKRATAGLTPSEESSA